MELLNRDEAVAVRRAVVRLNAQAWGIAWGLLIGLCLLVATLVLVVRGGEAAYVGQHLGLLANYFPGYRVTTAGAFIGFVYGFVLGYILGRLLGLVYNRIARA
jgi:tetrahydromethanopterin S-methyltransferase subunit B